jgi:hypothetical protein
MFWLGLMLTTHGSAIPATMVVLVVLIVFWLKKKSLNLREIIFAFLLFLMPFLPLIIFDLRHDFLNLTKIIELLTHRGGGSVDEGRFLFLRTFWRSIGFIDIPSISSNVYILIRLLALVSIVAFVVREKVFDKKILTITFVIVPILFLFFYQGNIPEYYYGLITALLPMFVTRFLLHLRLGKFLMIFVSFLMIYQILIVKPRPVISLAQKRAVINYLVQQDKDKYFNVSYDLPLGWDNGYEYLFKYYGRLPDRSDRGHLYSIVTLPTDQGGELVYQNGVLGVIRR